MDLALNNLQRLICYKIQPTNKPTSSGDLRGVEYAFTTINHGSSLNGIKMT